MNKNPKSFCFVFYSLKVSFHLHFMFSYFGDLTKSRQRSSVKLLCFSGAATYPDLIYRVCYTKVTVAAAIP